MMVSKLIVNFYQNIIIKTLVVYPEKQLKCAYQMILYQIHNMILNYNLKKILLNHIYLIDKKIIMLEKKQKLMNIMNGGLQLTIQLLD